MNYFILILVGVFSGIIGGMGMGGGTILIPCLVIFLSINQHLAQFINLAVFIPMSIITLIIHFKNKLVDTKTSLIILLFAGVFGLVGAIIALKTKSQILTICFGTLLIVLGIYQLVSALIEKFKIK